MSKLNHLEFMLNRQADNIFESSKSNLKLNSFNQDVDINKESQSESSETSSSQDS